MGHIAKACRSEKREKTTRGSPPQPEKIQQHKSSSGMHQVTPTEMADIVHINTVPQRKSQRATNKLERQWNSVRNGN